MNKIKFTAYPKDKIQEELEERTYWDETYTGKAQGGFFIRSNLFELIKSFEEKGYKVIGIKVTDSWNLEFICDVPKEK